MRQKICLMALIESVFKRGAYDRTLSYQTISEETHLPLDEVEHLVMKGLRFVMHAQGSLIAACTDRRTSSLNLLKGHLDQVDEKAYFTWVQPRVLSTEQIGTLEMRVPRSQSECIRAMENTTGAGSQNGGRSIR